MNQTAQQLSNALSHLLQEHKNAGLPEGKAYHLAQHAMCDYNKQVKKEGGE